MKIKLLLTTLVLISFSYYAYAEQGCPPGQYPIGGQGVAACAPIPQGGSNQQEARPLGKWIKTWGAIASDGGPNLSVSEGKTKKSIARDEALAKCKSVSGKECKIDFTYENQCAAVAEPYQDGKSIDGILSYAGAPTREIATNNAIGSCTKNNKSAKCRSIYTGCAEPIFKSY
ncbi:DUF4189 domain-containing protein [Xanthomonas vesicatoria]|uniref:DUF4189 domain-containing protein n=1 Tax=Xanthomonas vesicatoria TaxID=56460 RepID=A0ABS8LDY9_9XANT|nr:DUF4189 domain-containing protein [Xanthomonas vesicatoria]APO95059.1 hypothetical protein BI313_10990 [Xanthomonas vesicatoria]MCC8623966.1 DUF4189 domain-containing protein [Xanthomonas vesicatoria]MCC8626053.1 DUF4189 domain-containing protein [Xanthomonas vesicatoria]MCC8695334.1 DUF4189 domain-containing protein [Xanthomonas vesicatoria]MCC8704116.1 DUF4189 domain-containing protein [Xanthomonas vesicatoria]